MQTIAIYNSKGGCGKTTTSTSLAACLAALGERTLLVDLDAQGHCALGLGLDVEKGTYNSADLLDDGPTNDLSVPQVARKASRNLDLILADARLNTLRQRSGFLFPRLSAALDGARQNYGWCIIDCATSMDALTRAALELADEVIVPVETGYLGVLSLASLLPTLNAMRSRTGPRLRFRLLPSMYDPRIRLAREVLGELRARFTGRLSHSVIHLNARLAEAAGTGQAIADYDPASRGCQDFLSLAKELLAGHRVSPAPGISEDTSANSRAAELAVRARQLTAMTTCQLHGNPDPRPQSLSLGERLRQIYGVRQANGEVQFTARFEGARQVLLAGEFNNWSAQALECDALGTWQLQLPMQAGRYRYRYIVDGLWVNDPHNYCTEPNEFGEENNVVEVVQAMAIAA